MCLGAADRLLERPDGGKGLRSEMPVRTAGLVPEAVQEALRLLELALSEGPPALQWWGCARKRRGGVRWRRVDAMKRGRQRRWVLEPQVSGEVLALVLNWLPRLRF